MDGLISPILLYSGCIVGALGVCLALPRRGLSPQIIGALVFALAFGILMVGLGIKAPKAGLPNFNFYLFAIIALGSSLRVISHPRPVYAALYFILTILASAGMYVLLSAEFMAFALVIVYAGAILITYLFVIMLATETPTADQVEALADFDRYSREPAMATVVGFVLVAGMTTLMATGVPGAQPLNTGTTTAADLNELPRRVETSLRSAGLIGIDEHIAGDEAGHQSLDLAPSEGPARVRVTYGQGRTREITADDARWPRDLQLTNIEGIGFSLLRDNPGSIEVAGVILLMAMLGSVVLAQKKVELDEAAKLAAQNRSLASTLTLDNSPLMARTIPGAPNVREADVRVGQNPGGAA
ncbi:MAG TPA: NADH-quinone oxidoreductase subunit J [Phycisphaerales bacterium]|nr:NADH-quinone oxidoreductase subunit J [Phycisphaerales bacterium]